MDFKFVPGIEVRLEFHSEGIQCDKQLVIYCKRNNTLCITVRYTLDKTMLQYVRCDL